jgi:hypothetical protein
MTIQAFTMEGFGRPRRRVGVRGQQSKRPQMSRDASSGMGILPKGAHCKESFVTKSGVTRCVSYTRPKNWQALYQRADHARVGWRPLKQFDKPMKRDEVRHAIRQRKASGWAYKGYDEFQLGPERVPRWPLEGIQRPASVGESKMATRKRKPANKGKTCKRFGTAVRNGKRVRVCKSFGGAKKTGKGKGRCLKKAKTGKRCLKRAK